MPWRVHQVVGEDDAEGFGPDDRARTRHGMAQPQRLGLAQVDTIDAAGEHIAHVAQQRILALGLEFHLEFVRLVEVIGDRALVPAVDEHQHLGAGSDRLLGGVLDQRLVDDRQHLLRVGLGGRQETRAHAGDGENDFLQWFHDSSLRTRQHLARAPTTPHNNDSR
jgi:hypothetical protein